MKLLSNRDVIRWFMGELMFSDKRLEVLWGRDMLTKYYPNHDPRGNWTGVFGELAFSEYCPTAKKARVMRSKTPDFETRYGVFEIKNKMHSATFSRTRQILENVERYKSLPYHYKKPVIFVCMGGLEREEVLFRAPVPPLMSIVKFSMLLN